MVGGQNSIFQYRQHKYKRWICNIMASQNENQNFHIIFSTSKIQDMTFQSLEKTKQNVYQYFPFLIISFKHEIVILEI